MTKDATPFDVRQLDQSTSVIHLTGDITAGSEDALMEAYGRATGATTKAVILDFSKLEYMNSGGIGLLVTVLVRANRQKQRLLACGLTEHYRQIFELTRLDEAISIHDTEDNALAAVRA